MKDVFYSLINSGYKYIVGIDEVGRGCLAGPVVASAVILPLRDPKEFISIKDSKKLTALTREKIDKLIKNIAIDYAVGIASVSEIEKLNIANASLLAMKRAVRSLRVKPDYILVDGNRKIKSLAPQKAIIKGDEKCVPVSAASIIAKVFRDSLMRRLHKKYPAYNFLSNKGYPTKEHIKAIEERGICKIHRRTFKYCINVRKSEETK